MKIILSYIFSICLVTLIISGCEEDVESPGMDFSITQGGDAISEPFSVQVGEELTFRVIGSNLEKCAIWPGSDNKKYPDDYAKEGASGVNLVEGDEDIFEATFTYQTAGTYELTLIGSNWGYGGDDFKEVIITKQITIN